MHISVTGLRVKRWWHAPLFWRHAIASMVDAQTADGNITAETRTIRGVHHTLSAWESREHMLQYLRSPRHAHAMRRFAGRASGRVCGFEAEAVPTWEEALDRYAQDGRDVHQH